MEPSTNVRMIMHGNVIDSLHRQISSLLDLMQCTDQDCISVASMSTAAEMCNQMIDELMKEIDLGKKDWDEFYGKIISESDE